jgi:hypothetical protein
MASAGRMKTDNLIPEDAIGAELAGTFRRLLPRAKLVSLYDEYNTSIWGHADLRDGTSKIGEFSEEAKRTFHDSLVDLLKAHGGIAEAAVEGTDFVLLAESSKVVDAERLVQRLDRAGHIEYKGDEIVFVNEVAENPLYSNFTLRTKQGHWLCEALDAATFLKPQNIAVTHIVVLPDYMKVQQDKVWEILRVLGILPDNYHNFFYDSTHPPKQIARIIEDSFRAHGAVLPAK